MEDDKQYITATEFAQKHGMTKAWACRLCKQGRIAGAYKAGFVWVVPEDAKRPDPIRRGPIASPYGTRAKKALLAQVKREMAAKVFAKQSSALPYVKEKIYLRDVLGFCQMGDYWVRPVWKREQSADEKARAIQDFRLWVKAGRPSPAPLGYDVKTLIEFDPELKAKHDQLEEERRQYRQLQEDYWKQINEEREKAKSIL